MSTQDFFVTGSVSACVHCLFVVSFVPDSPSLSLLLEDFPRERGEKISFSPPLFRLISPSGNPEERGFRGLFSRQ